MFGATNFMVRKILTTFCFLLTLPMWANTWSIAQFGDVHASFGSGTASNDWQMFLNFVTTHTNDGVFNIKGVLSAGDLYEQNTNPLNQPVNLLCSATNLFYGLTNLVNAGVWVFLCNGNHDADDTNFFNRSQGSSFCAPNADWNSWLPPGFFSQQTSIGGVGYFGTKIAGDSRCLAMSYTNSGISILMVSCPWATNNFSPTDINFAYSNNLAWVTNMFGTNAGMTGIFVTHFLLNYQGNLAYWDTGLPLYTNIGAGQAILVDGLLNVSNIIMCLSGHTRTCLKTHSQLRNIGGNICDLSEFDTQSFTNYTQIFNLITFDSTLRKVFVRTYNIAYGRFMTNGEQSYIIGTAFGNFIHNWEFSLPVNGKQPIYAIRFLTSAMMFPIGGIVVVIGWMAALVIRSRPKKKSSPPVIRIPSQDELMRQSLKR